MVEQVPSGSEQDTGSGSGRTELAAYAGILGLGVALFWVTGSYPSRMPVWAPWDFSVWVYLATSLALLWFVRGFALTPREEWPPAWRIAAFLAGLTLTYAVLQTRFEYWLSTCSS